ncbi:hypothetical protein Tco_0153410 [Tanacetum coccineum]
MEEGQFLEHIVSKQGIKANPAKVQALTSLKRPKNIKEVQSLNKKLKALNRFLSKSVEKSLPLFKTLKGCLEKKDFRRTREADKAFEEMKKYIEKLSAIVAPKVGESLIVYLAATRECKFKNKMKKQSSRTKKAKNLSKGWKLDTHGASSDDGSRAGLMIVSPKVQYIRRNQNKKANALSKLASLTFEHLTKKVLVEKLANKLICEKQVADVAIKEESSWMTSIVEYLISGILPTDKKLARRINVKALNYRIIDGTLDRRSLLTPWLKCVGPRQVGSVIKEIHEGFIVAKVTTLGYY